MGTLSKLNSVLKLVEPFTGHCLAQELKVTKKPFTVCKLRGPSNAHVKY